MRFEIHFTVDGWNDYVVIDGSTIEEIRRTAISEVERRGGSNPWSREVPDWDE